MSDTQVPVLDHTVQITNIWLKKLMTEHHFASRHDAYGALRAVLHALRDRLTHEQAVHLGAQLPLLVRGLYYEGWTLAGAPHASRRAEEFLARVGSELRPDFPRDALSVTKAVFGLLSEEIDPGATLKVIGALPAQIKALWPVEA